MVNRKKEDLGLGDDPLWYKDAIIYELHVKAFYDSNEDGIGDFRGLLEKVDYLQDLGITAIWLLPFYPSPLRDDGYDIADYFNIHTDYGTLHDFRAFLKEAHRRGIRVITELVLNHTSDQHPWFQRARKARPDSTSRSYYVWSDSSDKYQDARIIFKDFETSNWKWDPVANAYFWHRFYYHQPDLNFDNPQVQKAVFKVIDFWFGMGVDGLRLDAVPYLYEREGTNCENLPESHEFLKKLRIHVDSKFENRMLLAEANQWPEDAAAYFGDGDECHMAFHFPIMPRIFMALWMEDRFPIFDILEQTPPIPDSCQWAMFLRNHDELTLEMVTDEERDYMYRVYARDPQARINLGIRRRLAPLLGNDRKRIELMNMILFSLTGTPIIYNGDEIGMGDNYYLGDRNGVRTPMQWSPDRNAGFSRTNPQKLYLPVIIDPEYHYEAVNVETQDRNPSSLLRWMKRVIARRKGFKAFGRGSIHFLTSDNPKVLAFIRRYEDEIILVIINLSRYLQMVRLDLSDYAGFVPMEIFSGNRFPIINELPYVLSIGFHHCYWFLLEKERVMLLGEEGILPEVALKTSWEEILEGRQKERFEAKILPTYIRGCRWFRAKARTISVVRIIEDILILEEDTRNHLLVFEVSYTEGSPEVYLLPISFTTKEKADQIAKDFPRAAITRLKVGDQEGILYDSSYDEEFQKSLLEMIVGKRRIRAKGGELISYPGKRFKDFLGDKGLSISSKALRAEQTNTSVLYDNTFFLKLYRRLEEGVNPDLEIIRFLTDKTKFSYIPPFAGAIEYYQRGSEPIVLGLLQGFVPNQGDAWPYTLETIGHYFQEVLSRKIEIREVPQLQPSIFEITFSDIPSVLQEIIGGFYLEMASILGKRTGELHLVLSSVSEDPNFAPEPFSKLYQRSVYQSMRGLVRRTIETLRKGLEKLPEIIRDEAASILSSETEILKRLNRITETKISAMKIRIHGDYHLGQVLFTGKDFVIIDFEGEPARPLGERRLKRSPFRDVAGMIRSFHYVVYSALLNWASIRPEDIPVLEPWVVPWYQCVSGIFLGSYLTTVGDTPLVPKEIEELKILFQALLLEKAVYELGYELNNRPDWVIIPIRGIQDVLKNPL